MLDERENLGFLPVSFIVQRMFEMDSSEGSPPGTVPSSYEKGNAESGGEGSSLLFLPSQVFAKMKSVLFPVISSPC